MKLNSKHPWYILDLVLFGVINAACLWYARSKLVNFETPTGWHLFLFGLAVFRGADVISNEKVTQALRAPFIKIEEKDGKDVEVPLEIGFKGALGSLLYCPSCSGGWGAMLLDYVYIFWSSVAAVIIFILALRGMERVCTLLLNCLKCRTL